MFAFIKLYEISWLKWIHVYIEIWDKGILKFNKFFNVTSKKEQQFDCLMFAFI